MIYVCDSDTRCKNYGLEVPRKLECPWVHEYFPGTALCVWCGNNMRIKDEVHDTVQTIPVSQKRRTHE